MLVFSDAIFIRSSDKGIFFTKCFCNLVKAFYVKNLTAIKNINHYCKTPKIAEITLKITNVMTKTWKHDNTKRIITMMLISLTRYNVY